MSESLIELVNYMNSENFAITRSKHKVVGFFDMKSEECFEKRDDKIWFKVRHELVYEEKINRLVIYHRTFSRRIDESDPSLINNARRDFEKYSYFEMTNWMVFGMDCVGKLKDYNDNRIDLLSFKTIKESGLNKIKNDTN